MILETKLQPPSLKPNTLRRERLLKLLKNNLERKILLVTGDAGYGKTTLLAQVIEEVNLPYVFYDLDKGDSDLVIFVSYLVHGLEKLQKGLASRTQGLIEQGGEVGKNYELLFGTLINELVEKRKEELFFILDDYHALPEDSMVHQALDYFIDHLPDIVHVVLASRTIPLLPSLAKWRAKQDLFELSREGLRFTEKEVKALLSEVYKLVLSEEELKRVFEQTEGWITGIQLILQSAGKDGKTVKETLNGYLEANQPLFDYFANEIYSRESTEVQDFLRKSSILEILTPEACDSILGKRDAVELQKEYRVSRKSGVLGTEALLKGLEKRNMFLSQVGKGEYKYHHLFREFLQGLIQEEGFRKALHLKAADYYQRRELWERVIEHYLEAGSYEWAGKVIIRVAEELVEKGRLTTLASWLKQMPDDAFEKQPRLITIQGELLKEQGDLEGAETSFGRAERLLRAQGDVKGLTYVLIERGLSLEGRGKQIESLKILRQALRTSPPSAEKSKGTILTAMGMAWMSLDDPDKARACLLKAKRVAERIQDFRGLVIAENSLGLCLITQGELRLAFDLFRPLIERIGKNYRLSIGIIFSNAARVAVDLGQVDWAEQCLKNGWNLCNAYEDPLEIGALHRAFGHLYMQEQEWEKALFHLEKARERFVTLGNVSVESATLRDLGRYYRYRGGFEDAKQHLDLAQQKGEQLGSSYEALQLAPLQAELSLMDVSSGHFEKGEKALKACLKLSRKSGWKREEFCALLARSAVHWGNKRRKEAFRVFAQTVRLAKLKGYDGIFARELRHSARLAELAQSLIQNSGEKFHDLGYLQAVLEKCGVPSLPSESESRLNVHLFGTLQLSLPDGRVVQLKWRSRKEASLFAYLLLHRDRVCNCEELTEALWPKAKRTQAENNLRSSVFRLKKALASGFHLLKEPGLSRKMSRFVVHQEKGYCLAPGFSFQLDAGEFLAEWQKAKSLEREGKAEAIQTSYGRCVELYRDAFLPNLGERWVEGRREDYERLYLFCLKQLASGRVKGLEFEEAIGFYRRYLAREPYSEEVHRELWKTLKAVGRKEDIRRDYKDLRKILRRDFDEMPQPETEEVFKELMAT